MSYLQLFNVNTLCLDFGCSNRNASSEAWLANTLCSLLDEVGVVAALLWSTETWFVGVMQGEPLISDPVTLVGESAGTAVTRGVFCAYISHAPVTIQHITIHVHVE